MEIHLLVSQLNSWGPNLLASLIHFQTNAFKDKSSKDATNSCADPGMFVRGGGGGGPGQSDKKSSDNGFLCFLFSPQLILQKSNG